MRLPLAVAALVLPSLAHAAGWSNGIDRGVPFYGYQAEGINLTVACDPEGFYSPPQNYIQASISGRTVNGPVVLSDGRQSVTLSFESGTAFKEAMTPENWSNAISILGNEEGFTFGQVTTGKGSDTPDQLASDCK